MTKRRKLRLWQFTMVSLLLGLLVPDPSSARAVTSPPRENTGYRLDVRGVQGQALPRDVEPAEVHKTVDGDTVEVVFPPDDWWYKVRIIGINAPESVKPNTPVQCYGKEASVRLAEILPVGSTVYLERDVSDDDQFGRLLRHVWVVDEVTGKAYLVSELLVRDGYADARRYRPDDKYDERLAKAELAAKHEHDGLWGACERGSGQH